MKVDKCKKTKICVDDEIKIGSWIRTKSENWHQVLKVDGTGYTQPTIGMSVQSRNEKKAKQRIYIFDGYFTNIRDIDEVYKTYDEMYEPNYTEVQLELMKFIM